MGVFDLSLAPHDPTYAPSVRNPIPFQEIRIPASSQFSVPSYSRVLKPEMESSILGYPTYSRQYENGNLTRTVISTTPHMESPTSGHSLRP